MSHREYGSFCPSFVGVDITFGSEKLYSHFVDLWTNPGVKPVIPNAGKASRFAHMAVGTVLEHELRHFHDFLWSGNGLSVFWRRAQAMLNSFGAIQDIFEDTTFDTVPVPIPEWLSYTPSQRTSFSDYLKHWPEFSTSTLWNPPIINTAEFVIGRGTRVMENIPEAGNELLGVIATQFDQIQLLREGFFDPPEGGIKITPRIAYEFSAYLAQTASVYKTYGEKEHVEFFNSMMLQSNRSSRVFMHSLRILSGHSESDIKNRTAVRIEELNWSSIHAAAFWILAGSYSLDEGLGCPANRLAVLLDAVAADPRKYTPANFDAIDLINHWTRLFETTDHFEAAVDNRSTLERQLENTLSKLPGDSIEHPVVSDMISVVRGVLDANSIMLNNFKLDLDSYINPYRYVSGLNKWPGAPTLLDISQTNFAFENLTGFSIRRSSNESRNRQLQYIPPLTSDLNSFDIKRNVSLRQHLTTLNVLFDHHQSTETDEYMTRKVIQDEFKKKLAFLS